MEGGDPVIDERVRQVRFQSVNRSHTFPRSWYTSRQGANNDSRQNKASLCLLSVCLSVTALVWVEGSITPSRHLASFADLKAHREVDGLNCSPGGSESAIRAAGKLDALSESRCLRSVVVLSGTSWESGGSAVIPLVFIDLWALQSRSPGAARRDEHIRPVCLGLRRRPRQREDVCKRPGLRAAARGRRQ